MFRLAVFVVSLLCGSVAAWMSFAWQPPAAPVAGDLALVSAPASAASIEVLVAASELQRGRSLDVSDMQWQSWPDSGSANGLIVRDARPTAIEDIQGSILRSGFIAGEPIREDKLVQAGSGFMAAMLQSGKRAVAVRISAENTAGGFILPDDHVDVIHTTQTAAGDGSGDRPVSRTILRNIRVLAIDQNTDGDGPEPVVVGKTATLELTPEQVEIAAAAESAGALSLALRSVGDMNETEIVAGEPPSEPEPERQERVVTMIQSGVSSLVTTRSSARN